MFKKSNPPSERIWTNECRYVWSFIQRRIERWIVGMNHWLEETFMIITYRICNLKLLSRYWFGQNNRSSHFGWCLQKETHLKGSLYRLIKRPSREEIWTDMA